VFFRQAWKQLGDLEAEQAMQEYISCVNTLDPEGTLKVITSSVLALYDYIEDYNKHKQSMCCVL
jgi:hypothetical protein